MGLSLTEILGDLVLILVVLGFLSLAFVHFVNIFLSPFGFYAAYSEGFSMCPAESVGFDYLALGDAHCAYVPGDVVVTFKKWPPDVNSVACAATPDYGIVCHRVYKYDSAKDQACFVGDHPRAKWTFCFSRDAYVGQAVFKLPRAFGVPGMAILVMKESVADFISAINAGKYPGLTH